MPDPRAHRGLPVRWLLPPPPREPELRARFDALPVDERRRLVRLGPEETARQPSGTQELVAALARARLATSWRALATAPLLGWLVLMTVWGFGRSTAPEHAQRYLLVGSALGAVTWLVVALRVAGRLRRSRAVLASLSSVEGE